MKRYDSYKDSGVEWIGEVPSHWDLVPLKRLLVAPMLYGANEPAESDDPMNPRYIRITDINENGKLRPETFKSLEFSKAKDYLLKRGDILFARSGSVGKTYMFDEDIEACFAGYLIKATCNKHKLLPKYLYFYTLSGAYGSWIHSAFSQSTIQNISASKYESLILTIPSIVEQLSIATYLDTKCAEIDHIISAQQKRIALLQELKQSVITRAVTKGLNPNVEMKESGVEWIGKVPKHWNIMRLNELGKYRKGPFGSSLKVTMFVHKGQDTIKVYQQQNAIKKDWRLGEDYILGSYCRDSLKNFLVKPRDIIVSCAGTIGECYIMPDDIEDGIINQALMKMTMDERYVNLEYFLLLFDILLKIESMRSSNGSAMKNIPPFEIMKKMLIPLPSIEEQIKNLQVIKNKMDGIDLSITKAQRQIALLEEYKQSLITEVVTGKRKVC